MPTKKNSKFQNLILNTCFYTKNIQQKKEAISFFVNFSVKLSLSLSKLALSLSIVVMSFIENLILRNKLKKKFKNEEFYFFK